MEYFSTDIWSLASIKSIENLFFFLCGQKHCAQVGLVCFGQPQGIRKKYRCMKSTLVQLREGWGSLRYHLQELLGRGHWRKLIWVFYPGISVPESVNTAVKDKCNLLNRAFITSLLLYSECFCNLNHLKFPFITKPHISLNWTSSSHLWPPVTEVKIRLVFAISSGNPLPKTGVVVLAHWNDGAILRLLQQFMQLHPLLV